MKHKLSLTGLLILSLILAAACSGAPEDEQPTATPAPEGPALVMFYTDN
jgi:hypothetical protein